MFLTKKMTDVVCITTDAHVHKWSNWEDKESKEINRWISNGGAYSSGREERSTEYILIRQMRRCITCNLADIIIIEPRKL